MNSPTFFTKIHEIVTQVFEGNTNWFDFMIGMSSIIILVGLKKLKTYSSQSEAREQSSYNDGNSRR